MFETAIPGGVYGYGSQQFGPLGGVGPQGYPPGYAGALGGQFGQPGAMPIGAPYGQQQLGAQQFGGQQGGGQPFGAQPFGTQPFGPQLFGGQLFGGQPFGGQPFGGQLSGGQPFGGQQIGQQLGAQQFGGQQLGAQQLGGQQLAQRFLPLIPQAPFPLTFGPGTVPFGGQQVQHIPGAQLYVVPVLTPQGWIGQLIVAGGPPLGAGIGAGFGGQQFAPMGGGQMPMSWGGLGYGYGAPQLAQGGGISGVPGGVGGGYSPLQTQQQIPQLYVPVPIGTVPFPGQPLATAPIH